MRNLEKQGTLLSQVTQLNLQQNIKVQQLDVTDQNSIHNFQLFLKEINRIDLLINNAGYANGGFVEEIQVDEYRKQFETNLLELYQYPACFTIYEKTKKWKNH